MKPTGSPATIRRSAWGLVGLSAALLLVSACSSSSESPASNTSTSQSTSSSQGTSTTPSSSSSSSTAQSQTPSEVTVEVKNFAFGPKAVEVAVGGKVTWKFEDSVAHTATSAGLFDSGNKSDGDTYSFTFPTAGTYNYMCTPHQYMTGTITVK